MNKTILEGTFSSIIADPNQQPSKRLKSKWFVVGDLLLQIGMRDLVFGIRDLVKYSMLWHLWVSSYKVDGKKKYYDFSHGQIKNI